MGFARLEEESVAGCDWFNTAVVEHLAAAGDDIIEFPLRAVRVLGIRNFTGRDSQDFYVEGMTLVEIGGVWLSAKGFGNWFAEPNEFPFR